MTPPQLFLVCIVPGRPPTAKAWVSRMELERRKEAAEWREKERLGQEGRHVMKLVRERY